MDTQNFNRLYLPLLVERLNAIETEIETLETYITEENFNEHFDDYVALQTDSGNIIVEIHRVSKEMKLSKKQFRNILNR